MFNIRRYLFRYNLLYLACALSHKLCKTYRNNNIYVHNDSFKIFIINTLNKKQKYLLKINVAI